MASTARASSSIPRPSTAMRAQVRGALAGHRGARTIEQGDRPCEEGHAALVVLAARRRGHDLRHPGLQGALAGDEGVDRGHVARQRLIEDAARESLRVLAGLGLGCDRVHLPEVARDCGRISGSPRAILRPRRSAGAGSGVGGESLADGRSRARRDAGIRHRAGRSAGGVSLSGVRPGAAYIDVLGRCGRGGRDAAKQECHGHHPKSTPTGQQPDDPARQRDGGHDTMVRRDPMPAGAAACASPSPARRRGRARARAPRHRERPRSAGRSGDRPS